MLQCIGRNTLTGIMSAQEKHPCFIVYTTAQPEESPLVTSGLRVSVQLAKPASPIRLLCKPLVVFLRDRQVFCLE